MNDSAKPVRQAWPDLVDPEGVRDKDAIDIA
jgi:hypothetical protein